MPARSTLCVPMAICPLAPGKGALQHSTAVPAKSERPPLLYDLTSLQRDANRVLGFTAQQTLDYTQALYEKTLSDKKRSGDTISLVVPIAWGASQLVRIPVSELPAWIERGLGL